MLRRRGISEGLGTSSTTCAVAGGGGSSSGPGSSSVKEAALSSPGRSRSSGGGGAVGTTSALCGRRRSGGGAAGTLRGGGGAEGTGRGTTSASGGGAFGSVGVGVIGRIEAGRGNDEAPARGSSRSRSGSRSVRALVRGFGTGGGWLIAGAWLANRPGGAADDGRVASSGGGLLLRLVGTRLRCGANERGMFGSGTDTGGTDGG